ncbi:hypothetical protein SDC9_196278 [bioreactor metagenome]|uniref:Uncharacterized protein n=1 Tax=bioreactor metagenome TaxID=1076179 RepID=A0A645ICM6_9ZZZZ
MDYFYNCTPTRQFVIYNTACGCVGYGWPLPDEKCCHGRKRSRKKGYCKHFNPFWQYPYCKDYSCIAPFLYHGGFLAYGHHEFGSECCD